MDLERLKAENSVEGVTRRLGIQGQGKRLWCPSCQPGGASQHKTPDLALYDGGFKCWKCGASGDVIALVQLARKSSFKDALEWLDYCRLTTPTPNNITRRGGLPQPPHHTPVCQAGKPGSLSRKIGGGDITPPPEAEANLDRFIQACRTALPRSAGERYLELRGFNPEVAAQFGVGFCPSGCWPHRARDWRLGRLVFPHHDPGTGELVNVYGRAIETSAHSAPKHKRHAHLPGPKSVFNVSALSSDNVVVCEGAFDCLAMLCSGYPNVIAIFGVTGLRWDWFRSSRKIVFALDQDDAGERAFRQVAMEAVIRGKEVFRLRRESYRGEKDLAAAFATFGRIEIASL